MSKPVVTDKPDSIFVEVVTVDDEVTDFGPYRWRKWSVKPFDGATEYRRVLTMADFPSTGNEETEWIAHEERHDCPHCGSGHKDDALSASPAEPVAWAFFSKKGYEHFLKTRDQGYMSDLSIVPEFVAQKSKENDITVPLFASPVNETERLREALESAIAWIITLGGNPPPDDTNADQIQIAVLASLRAALGRKP